MRSLLVSGAADYSDFDILLRSLESSLQKCLANSDDLVVREACITIGFLCQQLGPRFAECALSLLPTLMLTLQCNTKDVASAVMIAMRFVVKNVPDYRLLKTLDENIISNSSVVRLACCQLLADLLTHWPSGELAKDLSTIKRMLCNGIADADDDARAISRQALTAFSHHFLLESEVLQNCVDVQHELDEDDEEDRVREDTTRVHHRSLCDWSVDGAAGCHGDPRAVVSELNSIRHDSEFIDLARCRGLSSASSCELNFIQCDECGGQAVNTLSRTCDDAAYDAEAAMILQDLDCIADTLITTDLPNPQPPTNCPPMLETSNTCSQVSCVTDITCDTGNVMNNLETIEQLVFRSVEQPDVDPSSIETDDLLNEALSSNEMASILSKHTIPSEPVHGGAESAEKMPSQDNNTQKDIHFDTKSDSTLILDDFCHNGHIEKCKTPASGESSNTSVKQTITESKTVKRDFSTADERLFTIEFEAVPKIKVSCDSDLNKRMCEVKASLQTDRSSWQDRVKSLKLLRSILIAYKSDDMKLFHELLRSVEPGLQVVLKDSRPSVVREACITIMYYCKQLANDFDHTACTLLPSLSQLTVNNGAPLMATAAAVCMDLMVRHVRSPSLLACIASLLRSKSNSVRRQCYHMVERVLQTWPQSKLTNDVEALKNYVCEGLRDRDAKARSISRRAFCSFARHFPEEAALIYRDVDCTNRRLLSGLVDSLDLPATPIREGVAAPTRPIRRSRKHADNSAAVISRNLSDNSAVGQTVLKKPDEKELFVKTSSATDKVVSTIKSTTEVKSKDNDIKKQTTETKVVEAKKSNKSIKKGTSKQKCVVAKATKVSNVTLTKVVSAPSTDFKPAVRTSTVTNLHHNTLKKKKKSNILKKAVKTTSADFKSVSSDVNVTPVNQLSDVSVTPVNQLSDVNVKVEPVDCERTHSELFIDTKLNENSRTETSLRTEQNFADVTKQQCHLNVCSESQTSNEDATNINTKVLPTKNAITAPPVSKIPISPMKRTSNNQLFINKAPVPPQPTEESLEERQAGQLALQRLLYYKTKLSRVELKKVIRIFTKMFQQPHDEAFCTFLLTLSELVSSHAAELSDWLPNCLSSLLRCDAQLLHPGGQNDFIARQHLHGCLNSVREAFPKDRQMGLLLGMILDISDVTELGNVTTSQMQQTLLNYTSDLITSMEPTQFTSSLRVQLSIAKIICWANDTSNRDVATAARNTLVGLMSLNPLEFKQIIATLPSAFQTISIRVIEEKLTDWNMYSCAAPMSKVNSGDSDEVTRYGARLVHSH